MHLCQRVNWKQAKNEQSVPEAAEVPDGRANC